MKRVKSAKIVGTTEILGAILGRVIKHPHGFKSDPKGYIFSHANYDVGDDVDIEVVENGDGVVHLPLPYYLSVENFRSSHLGDDDMVHFSGGGEIFISLIVAVGLTVAAGSSLATVGLVTAISVEASGSSAK